jgi:hypothetical protein
MPMADAHTEAREVEILLQRQQELFSQLDAMSQRQSALIEAQDTDQLLSVLAERQAVIERIAETSARLEPYRASWDAVMRGLDEPGRARVRRRIDVLSDLAERVAKRDEADRAMLEERRDAVAGEITQINRGRGAVAAYGGKPQGPRMQDREA